MVRSIPFWLNFLGSFQERCSLFQLDRHIQRMLIMRIREITRMGTPVWPPQWSNSSHSVIQNAVLDDVKLIIGTELVRIDVVHQGIPHLGLMFVDRELRPLLYGKLKENLGRCLTEIADLEIEPGQ